MESDFSGVGALVEEGGEEEEGAGSLSCAISPSDNTKNAGSTNSVRIAPQYSKAVRKLSERD